MIITSSHETSLSNYNYYYYDGYAVTTSLPSSVNNTAEGAKDESHGTNQAHSAGKLHSSSSVAGLHIELIVEPATIEHCYSECLNLDKAS